LNCFSSSSSPCAFLIVILRWFSTRARSFSHLRHITPLTAKRLTTGFFVFVSTDLSLNWLAKKLEPAEAGQYVERPLSITKVLLELDALDLSSYSICAESDGCGHPNRHVAGPRPSIPPMNFLLYVSHYYLTHTTLPVRPFLTCPLQ
jgi:hypothetical protein